MYRLYEFSLSGNCYKVRFFLTQLGIPFERIEIDITKDETANPEFLKKNPNSRVPVLEIKEGQYLWESNAILFYLAEGTDFFPEDKFQRASVLQWMFFEQYDHEPNIATPRYWISILGKADEYLQELKKKQELGYEALDVMESHLARQTFFVGNRYTIADIALYAYTHVAHEGGFDLSRFPAIQKWFKKVEEQPRYLKITE